MSCGRQQGWSAGGMAGWRMDRSRIPWMKGFRAAERHQSVLSEELEAFETYVRGCFHDVGPLLADVRSAAQSVCSAANATPSIATIVGVAVPQGPYLVDVTGLSGAEEMSVLCCLLEAEGYQVIPQGETSVRINGAHGASMVRLVDETDAVAAAAIAAELQQHPEVRRVTQVLTHILWQSGLLTEKGIPVPVLATMIAAVRREGASGADLSNPSMLFHATLSHYSAVFDPRSAMITLRGCRALPAGFEVQGQGIWVCHPSDPATNMAHEMSTIARVRNLFLHCGSALRRWDGPLTHPHGECSRGKSPLASVIAFNKLAAAYLDISGGGSPRPPQTPVHTALDVSERAARRASAASSSSLSGSLSQAPTEQHMGHPLSTPEPEGSSSEEELVIDIDEDLPPMLLNDDDDDDDEEQGGLLNPNAAPFTPVGVASALKAKATRRGARGKGRGQRGQPKNLPPVPGDAV